jgi:polysaccharide pyruvyl transferase WcaK-like protein
MRADLALRRIALFGNFGTGNLGNEATLQAMVYNLRRRLPNVEITCICPGPENTASEYNISAVPIRASFPIWKLSVSSKDDKPAVASGSVSGTTLEAQSGTELEAHRWFKAFARLRRLLRICTYPLVETYRCFKAISTLKESDMVVMTGTGMLGDYGITPLGLHYDIFRWSVIAKLCGCKLLFVSVGGGPIRHRLSRCFIRVALALANYRSYRDAASKEYLEAIGIDVKNDPVFPDLAFSLPIAVNHDPGRQDIVIGVGVMNYHNRLDRPGNDETIYHDYLGRLASFVVRLLELRYTVRILIGDFVWDVGARRDLRRELEERGFNYKNGRIIDEPASSIDGLLSQLSSVDVVISSRFHNLLLGLMLGKPVIAISYHEKFQPLMTGVGLGKFCQDIEHIDVDELIGKVVTLQENAPGIKLQIARETESYRIALDEQYEVMLKDISSS